MTGRVYPAAVWWLPKRVRDALTWEEGMRGIAAQPVEGGESPVGVCVEELEPQPVHAAPIKREPPVASVMPGQIFPPDTDKSSSAQRFLAEDRSVVQAYHVAATSGDGAGFWCRIDGCLHRAPVPGGVCPVHADEGFESIDVGGDAA